MKKLVLALSIFTLGLYSCGEKKEENKKDNVEGCEKCVTIDTNFDEIEFHFSDSSVPPEYHRSYNILVSKDSIELIVTSYQDTLAKSTISISESDFEKIRKATIHANEVRPKTTAVAESGSTMSYLDGYTAGKEAKLFKWNSDTPKELQDVIDIMKSLIPDANDLINIDYPEHLMPAE